MRASPLFLLALVAACDCGASHDLTDAGRHDAHDSAVREDSWEPDGGPDSAPASDAGVPRDTPPDSSAFDTGPLPAVDPGLPCPADADSEDAVCVDAGWFVISQWSPLWYGMDSAATDEEYFSVRRPVYLDRFWMDTHEVTFEEYDTWALANGTEMLTCEHGEPGWPANWETIDGEVRRWPMKTRFSEETDVSSNPGTCVSATQARSYCEAQGGRLPTVYEWFRAAGVPYDNEDEFDETTRRFPWGNELPDPFVYERYSTGQPVRLFVPANFDPYLVPGRGPVGRFPELASAEGVQDMTGGVSEWLAGCVADYRSSGTSPLVRPSASPCVGELAVGSHWLSTTTRGSGHPEALLSYGLLEVAVSHEGGHELDYVGGPEHMLSRQGLAHANGDAGIKSWVLGFRCVYDARLDER